MTNTETAPRSSKITIREFQNQIDSVVSTLFLDYRPVRLHKRKIIRDAVFGFNSYFEHEINLIDSPLIQRLRNIFQTSLAAFVYPCSNHSRFEHSFSCVGHASKMGQALRGRHNSFPSEVDLYELRLAALLHDTGHGPFSHATEAIYEAYPGFGQLRNEAPKLFNNPENGAGEILSYFIVTSTAFRDLWERIKQMYRSRKSYYRDLERINLSRVGQIILGKSHVQFGGDRYYLDQIINGPFDVDKVDYIHRDGYFTGLDTSVDFERLLETIRTWEDGKNGYRRLAVDVSGVTCLEQILFSKMLLFAVVYHHHKVRASFHAIRTLFDRLKENNWRIKGLNFDSPFDFLQVDDYDIMNGTHQPIGLQKTIDSLKNRRLPAGALVMAKHTCADEDSRESLVLLTRDNRKVNDLRETIAHDCKLKTSDVHLDIPREPSFRKISQQRLVCISDRIVTQLEDIFPTSGWTTAFSQNRYRAFVFCPAKAKEKVAATAARALRDEGVKLTATAFELAKHRPHFINHLKKKRLCFRSSDD